MNPFELLGIERGATPIEVKRAYARAVKAHRPDTDPEGFQRVTEAYETCLAHASGELTFFEDDEAWMPAEWSDDSAPESTTTQADDDSFATPYVDDDANADDEHLQPFLAELERRARAEFPAALGDWLRGIDRFYSLEAKGAAADAVVAFLDRLEEPLAPATLEVVLAFFNLDSVNQPRLWLNGPLARLRSASHGARAFDAAVRAYRLGDGTPVDRMLANEVLGPRNPWRSLLVALVPGFPRRACAIRAELVAAGREHAHRRIDAGVADFWLRVTDLARFDVRRLGVVALRLVVAFGLLTALFGSSRRPELVQTVFAVLAGGWAVLAGVAFLVVRWQERRSLVDVDGESLVVFVIALAMVAVARIPPQPLHVLVLIAAVFVGQHAVRGDHDPPRLVVAALLGMAPVLGLFTAVALDGDALVGAWLGPAIALMVMVALDEAYARRHDLHLSEVRVQPGWLPIAAWTELGMLVAWIVYAIVAVVLRS